MISAAAWVGAWFAKIVNYLALGIGYTIVAIIAIVCVVVIGRKLLSSDAWRFRRRKAQNYPVNVNEVRGHASLWPEQAGSGSPNAPAGQTPVGTIPRGTANISANSGTIGIGYRLAFERLTDDEIAAVYTRFGLAIDSLKLAEKALCQGKASEGYEQCKAALTAVQALCASDQRKHWFEAMVQLDLARLAHGADAQTESQQRYTAADEIIACWETELEWLRPIYLRHRRKPVPA